MILILITITSICVSCGVLLLLSRDLFKMVMGIAVIGAAANLIVFIGGRPGSLVPALIKQGKEALAADAASPLPQALVLTAIVIGFALLCFALMLAVTTDNQQKSADIASYRQNEPSPPAQERPEKPPVMETDT